MVRPDELKIRRIGMERKLAEAVENADPSKPSDLAKVMGLEALTALLLAMEAQAAGDTRDSLEFRKAARGAVSMQATAAKATLAEDVDDAEQQARSNAKTREKMRALSGGKA